MIKERGNVQAGKWVYMHEVKEPDGGLNPEFVKLLIQRMGGPQTSYEVTVNSAPVGEGKAWFEAVSAGELIVIKETRNVKGAPRQVAEYNRAGVVQDMEFSPLKRFGRKK